MPGSGFRLGIRRTFGLMPEEIVRPFVSVESFSRRRVVVEVRDVPEAFLEWGQPSQFSFDDSFRDLATDGRRFKVNDPNPDDDESIKFTETGRTVKVVRVVNPEDETVYVDVERIERINFSSAGKDYTFILRN